MKRLVHTFVLLAAAMSISAPSALDAQAPATPPGPETAADVVEAILSGRDDPAVWGALEEALGEGSPRAALGVSSAADDPGGAIPPEGRPALDGAGREGGAAFLGRTVRLPTWMRVPENQRLAAGVVAGLLTILLLFAGWQGTRLMIRAFRSVTSRGGRGRTLVRRRNRDLPPSRDAERLHAQLRARRAA